RGRQTAAGELEHVGEGGVGERKGGGARDQRWHVGHAVVHDAGDDVGRIEQGGGTDRLHAAALIDRDVDDDRTLLHGRHHFLGDQDGGPGAGDQHGADEHVGAAQHLTDVEAVGYQRDDATVKEVVDRAQPVDVDVQDGDVGAQA